MGLKGNSLSTSNLFKILLVLSLMILCALSVSCVSDYLETADDSGASKETGANCAPGSTRCNSGAVELCLQGANGQRSWTVQVICTPGFQACKEENGIATCVTLPSCTDGKKNQDETDIDCGGTLCGPCADQKDCQADTDCINKVCINKKCMPCRAQQYGCMGNLVRRCKSDNSGWDTIKTCKAASYQKCNHLSGNCEPLSILGSSKPTGKYYLFAYFETGQTDFKGGYDVDGFENFLYVNNKTQLDVYSVKLEDTDADSKHEPNQHPENKDKPGPIEKRILKFIKTYTNVKLGTPSIGEIFATKDRIYFLKRDGSVDSLYEFIFASGQTNLVVKGSMYLSCLGLNEANNQWYGAYNSSKRVVFSYWPKGGGWAAEFWYPDLAGSHLDGIEVVTDPKTKTPYIYVSDMTSDFLAQYYIDKKTGKWVQKNVFEYKENQNQYVEGMGFGAFQHFWATSGKALYEVGGGDLQKYVDPLK